MEKSVKEFSKSIAIFANSEDQVSLSRALTQLCEVYEQIEDIYKDQSNSDYLTLGELVKDYVGLFENIKEVFYQRVNAYGEWQKANEILKRAKKGDIKEVFRLYCYYCYLQIFYLNFFCINKCEYKVARARENFEEISYTIKEEMKRFDLERVSEFRIEMIEYIEKLYQNQEKVNYFLQNFEF
jgi:sorting nexin-1/2